MRGLGILVRPWKKLQALLAEGGGSGRQGRGFEADRGKLRAPGESEGRNIGENERMRVLLET